MTDENLIGTEEIEALLSQQLGKQCHVEGYYQHNGPGQDVPEGTELLKVWVEEENKWKWFTHGTISHFQEIEYQVNYWTVCWLTNEDFPMDQLPEDMSDNLDLA